MDGTGRLLLLYNGEEILNFKLQSGDTASTEFCVSNEVDDCIDNEDSVSALGGCQAAVELLGCNYIYGGFPISELCPISCYTFCPIYGCMDITACNYDNSVNVDDGSCEFAANGFTCDGECINGG